MYQLTNVAYGAFLSTIFSISLAILTVFTSEALFTSFVNTVIDIKNSSQNIPAEVGLIILGKGILFGTTVYIVCQVIADRIFTIWSPASVTNGDIMQKFKGMLDSSTTTT